MARVGFVPEVWMLLLLLAGADWFGFLAWRGCLQPVRYWLADAMVYFADVWRRCVIWSCNAMQMQGRSKIDWWMVEG